MINVTQLDQAFPDELAKVLAKLCKTVPWRYGWASNRSIEFTHWNHDFVHAGADNGVDVSHRLKSPLKEAWQYLQDQYLGPQDLLRCYTNSHTYGVEGYPHTDSKRSVDNTIVIYMTPKWDRAWGGETVVYDGNEIVHAELPSFNKALIFPGAAWHCARSVSRICPAQRITLMFKYAPKGADPMRERIQLLLIALGANKTKHSKNTLMGHLLRVYDNIKAEGYDVDTCAAAGLHSIFGTNAFLKVTTENERVIGDVVGETALDLIRLFRDCDRPRTLETALQNKTTTLSMRDGTTRTVSPKELNSICAIEAFNLADQNSLKKWPLVAQYRQYQGT